MTSYAPVSGPCYILRKYSSPWKAFLRVPDTKPAQAQWLPTRLTPLLCLGQAELLPASMVPGTLLLEPRSSRHCLTLPPGRTEGAITSNKALSVWARRSGTGSISGP